MPRAAFTKVTAKLKGEVSIPLCTTNRINTPEVAEQVLAEGDADMVSMARPFLADPDFVFTLPLHPSGTAFQRRVWEQISAIPSHQTRTYGELAKALHNAPRAVGQACGANPFPLAVPCHRVIATGGGLGGFARQRGGFLLDIKRWLLAPEGL